ncbi:MAG: hypothetical protein QNJ97_01400, partial [Myxococcota bacterium]|nr:hypothetical protein [Myxococcota bacterium]
PMQATKWHSSSNASTDSSLISLTYDCLELTSQALPRLGQIGQLIPKLRKNLNQYGKSADAI